MSEPFCQVVIANPPSITEAVVCYKTANAWAHVKKIWIVHPIPRMVANSIAGHGEHAIAEIVREKWDTQMEQPQKMYLVKNFEDKPIIKPTYSLTTHYHATRATYVFYYGEFIPPSLHDNISQILHIDAVDPLPTSQIIMATMHDRYVKRWRADTWGPPFPNPEAEERQYTPKPMPETRQDKELEA